MRHHPPARNLGRRQGGGDAGNAPELFGPVIAAGLWENDRRVLDTGQPTEVEEEVVGGGQARTYWSSKFPLVDEDGEVFAVAGISSDVTERKRAEQEIHALHEAQRQALSEWRASRDRLVVTLESISDAFVSIDREWQYTYVNRRAGEMFDRRPEDLIGRHIWTEFPEGVGQTFYHAYNRAVAEQQPVIFEDYYPPWDRWYENRVFPSSDSGARRL